MKNPNRKNILNSSKYRYGVHNSKAMAHWPEKGEKSNNSDYDYYLPFEFEHQFKKSSFYTQNEAPVIINDHIFNFWGKKKKSHYGEAGALIKYLQFLNLNHFHWTKVSISNFVSMWLDLNDFIININRYKLVIALTMYLRERSSTFWLDYFISYVFFTRIISLLTRIKIMIK